MLIMSDNTRLLACLVFFCMGVEAHVPGVYEWDMRWQRRPINTKIWRTHATKNAGLKARITSKGLNYATTKAIEELSKNIQGQRIPDQHGKSGHVEYWVSKMVIKGFNKPSSNIVLKPSSGLQWTANGMGLSAKGDWSYKYKKGWVKIEDSGSFDISINNANFELGIQLGSDSSGKPTIKSNSCNANIGSVSVKFRGGASWIYNLFKGPISDAIRKAMNPQICNILKKEINTDANEALQKLPVTVVIGKKALLDYSFLRAPLFNPAYMETFHKGEVTWMTSHKDPPFPAPPLADLADTSRMFYIWISDYVFNSMTYAAHTNGFLTYKLTKDDLPLGQRQALNVDCPREQCIGNYVTPLRKFYPNSTVQLRLMTTSAPTMSSTSADITVKSFGKVVFDVLMPNGTLVDTVITLNASMIVELNITVKGEKIYAKVFQMPIKANVIKSESKIPGVSDVAINFVIKSALSQFVKPKLEELGNHGFPLPVTDKVKFTNPKITLAKDTLIIATDIVYG